jgi:predicted amidophosphoribosyltransferase
MTAGELMRCELCGQFLPWNPVGICRTCSDRLDEEFVRLRDHLAQHPGLSAPDLERETGVPLAHIQWLVRHHRLTADPQGAGLCSVCGQPSTETLCPACRQRLGADRRRTEPFFRSRGTSSSNPPKRIR